MFDYTFNYCTFKMHFTYMNFQISQVVASCYIFKHKRSTAYTICVVC